MEDIFIILIFFSITVAIVLFVSNIDKRNKTFRKNIIKKAVNNTKMQKETKQNTPTNNIVYWQDKLNNWKNGEDIPKITEPVIYQTSPITRNAEKLGVYKEYFAKAGLFEIQNYSPYKEYLEKEENKNKFIAFDNLPYSTNNGISKCYLVVPPLTKDRYGKDRNYSNIYTFYKNTNEEEKKQLWISVAYFIEEYMNKHKNHNKFYISLHGGSVAYLHVRICREPKYYSKKFLKSL